jgi:peptidoglycan-N-acetylmuramic acid deacetylase
MKKIIVPLIGVFLLSSCGTLSEEEINEPVEVSGTENTKYGWGFKKNPGGRPDFTKNQINMMEKHGCIYIGSEDEKVMYLTFDEGYENGYTSVILDTLKKHDVPAAFFVTGPYLEKQKELVDRMVNEGHIVGNHTVNHPSLPDCGTEKIKTEITGLSDKFYDTYGIQMKYLRPPMGEYSERTLKVSSELGYTNVFWSFAYRDWEVNNQKGERYAFDEVTKNFHNGAVILLHAVSRDNALALDSILTEAKNRGYVWKSLDNFK